MSTAVSPSSAWEVAMQVTARPLYVASCSASRLLPELAPPRISSCMAGPALDSGGREYGGGSQQLGDGWELHGLYSVAPARTTWMSTTAVGERRERMRNAAGRSAPAALLWNATGWSSGL